MEADMAVEIFTRNPLFELQNVIVDTLIGDEDSSTFAAVSREASHPIQKWSDYNHIKKGFTSYLYSIKLSHNLIEYFGNQFGIAIKKNKGNISAMKQALQAIVPHSFDDHTLCGDWCDAKLGKTHIHKYLPHKKPLTDLDLKLQLDNKIKLYVQNLDKIVNCGSTQANESVNHMIASKNPKSKHYCSSESLCFRVSAGVSQKNLGISYVDSVFKKLGYHQSRRSILKRGVKEGARVKRRFTASLITSKKRRKALKRLSTNKNSRSTRKEGISYESGFALSKIPVIERSVSTNIENSVIDLQSSKVIVYDIETTGFSIHDDIVQVK